MWDGKRAGGGGEGVSVAMRNVVQTKPAAHNPQTHMHTSEVRGRDGVSDSGDVQRGVHSCQARYRHVCDSECQCTH
jgi:hypothetical protein